MLSGVVLVLLVLVFALLLLRFFLIHKERKLGYPKADESFDDVKLLLLLQQDIFALRLYRRLYPKASFAEAKYIINKLRVQLTNNAQTINYSGSLKNE